MPYNIRQDSSGRSQKIYLAEKANKKTKQANIYIFGMVRKMVAFV